MNRTHLQRAQILFFVCVLTLTYPSAAAKKNGFDLSKSIVSAKLIKQGGPPRDGIPSIDKPSFFAARVPFLRDTHRILGVVIDGEARAYPIPILTHHEIVNDIIAGRPIVITYCPLCRSGMAFEASIQGSIKSFGVSGLLYNSDVLLYDRKTESLWSQIMGEAISGPLVGKKLTLVPISNTTWGAWKKEHPRSLVLSPKTGFKIDYTRQLYPGYDKSRNIWFPVAKRSRRLHPKALVVGLELDGEFKAYPLKELKHAAPQFQDRFSGQTVKVLYDSKSESATIQTEDGSTLPTVTLYWFSWYAFHPNTLLYQSTASKD